MPSGPGVRVDTGIGPGDRVPPEYDNLIAKVMVHAGDRDAAIDRLRRALDETEVSGIQTTLPFHAFVARAPSFRAAALSTGWVGEHWDGPAAKQEASRLGQLAAGIDAMRNSLSGRRDVPTTVLRSADGGGGRDGARDGRWHRSGLDAAQDRWPR
jgi:acetyl/propionyl-CoA carboxylase alpha subunit